MRALISVWDKTGLDTLATGLDELGWELVASGGTAAAIEGLGLEVTRVEDVTRFPELLGGRVRLGCGGSVYEARADVTGDAAERGPRPERRRLAQP